MIRHDERKSLVQMSPASQVPERIADPQQRLGCEGAEGDDDRRPHQLHLSKQERRAGFDLFRKRVPIARRPALENVADEDLGPREAHAE